MEIIITDKKMQSDNSDMKIKVSADMNEEETIESITSLLSDVDSAGKTVDIGLSKKGNFSYILNSLIDYCNDNESKITTSKIIFFIDNLSNKLSYDLDVVLNKPIMQTVNHSFGDYGDPLKGKFEKFDSLQYKGPNFRDKLIEFIDKGGYTKNSQVYKAAGISKYTFNKILSFAKNHRPSKDTVAALTIGLKLNIEEAQDLFHSAGYHLGTTDRVDRIIRFFISESIYNIDEVNFCLYYYGYPILGEKPRESVKFEMD